MLIIKISTAVVCLYLISLNIESTEAWNVILSIGSDPSNRQVLQKKTVVIPTSPDRESQALFVFKGNEFNTIRQLYVARWEKNAELQMNKDYFATVVGGGLKETYVTLDFLVRPNPKNESMSFEVQLIGNERSSSSQFG